MISVDGTHFRTSCTEIMKKEARAKDQINAFMIRQPRWSPIHHDHGTGGVTRACPPGMMQEEVPQLVSGRQIVLDRRVELPK